MVSNSIENGISDLEMDEKDEGFQNCVYVEIKNQKFTEDFIHGLDTMRKNRKFCDVVLQLKTGEIYAHRVILASISRYFFKIFSCCQDTTLLHYQLPEELEKDIVEKLVEYAYSGKLSIAKNELNLLYTTAFLFKMNIIVDQCRCHLLQSLKPSNCIGLRSLKNIELDPIMIEKLDEYISLNFLQISDSQELKNLHCINIELFHTADKSITTKPFILATKVVDWLQRVCKEEEFTLDTLTEKHHLLYLHLDNSLHDCADIQVDGDKDSDVLQEYRRVSKNFHIAKNKAKAEGRHKVLQNHSNSDEENNLISTFALDLHNHWKVIAAINVSSNSILSLASLSGRLSSISIVYRISSSSSSSNMDSLHQFSLEQKELVMKLAPMSSARCALGSACLQEKLFACGGYDRIECLTIAELYDPTTNTWTALPDMLRPRGRFAVAIVDNCVYAVGGSDGSTELAAVEKFDFKKNQWLRVASLPQARSHVGACTLNKYVYCIGGCIGQQAVRQCDMFNCETEIWMPLASLHIGRYQAGVTVFNDKIFVAGGSSSGSVLNSAEVYDPLMDTWHMIAPMITLRRGCGMVVYQGKLWVIGGSDGSRCLNTTEIYDSLSNSWSVGPSMAVCRANVSASVVNGRIYAVGGFSGKKFLNTIECLDPSTNLWTMEYIGSIPMDFICTENYNDLNNL